jgi:hypothetical protein
MPNYYYFFKMKRDIHLVFFVTKIFISNLLHNIIAFFATKEELYYIIAGYINTLQTLWIIK